MDFDHFLTLAGDLPVIETSFLLAGRPDSRALLVQMGRWEKAGKLVQVKRGIYVLGDAYRKVGVFEPYLSSLLVRPSYISLEKALEHHGLIPEAVPVYTALTTRRPAHFSSPVGEYAYQHIQRSLFWGYRSIALEGQTGFVADAEKALLDFFYFKSGPVTPAFLEQMRLQPVDTLDCAKLKRYAARFGKPKIRAAADMLVEHYADIVRQETRL